MINYLKNTKFLDRVQDGGFNENIIKEEKMVPLKKIFNSKINDDSEFYIAIDAELAPNKEEFPRYQLMKNNIIMVKLDVNLSVASKDLSLISPEIIEEQKTQVLSSKRAMSSMKEWTRNQDGDAVLTDFKRGVSIAAKIPGNPSGLR